MSDPFLPILEGHLYTFAVDNSYPLYVSGEAFISPDRTPYLRRTHHLATPSNTAISHGLSPHQPGVFQVDVMSPEEDREGGSREIAYAVRDHFSSDTGERWLVGGGVTIRVRRGIHVRTTYPEGNYLKTVVDISWYADKY